MSGATAKAAMRAWALVLALAMAAAGLVAHAGAVLSNGVVSIGVNNEGDLIFQGVGLTYVPTRGEALAPGCPCEGWGVADVVSRSFGKSGRAFGIQNVVVESFTSTSSTARSVVRVVNGANAVFRVTEDFHVSAQTANLFEATITIENLSAATVDVRYRRAMDWDVPPTTFNEVVTIVTNAAQDVVFSSDNGFADGNPLNPAGAILFTGERADSGPTDHGAVFDFNLGTLAPGKTRTFDIYYGAAANEPEALHVLAAIGAEVYSLGKPFTPSLTPPGSPNTYIFAFKGVGGTPAVVRDADLTLGGLDLVDNGTGQPLTLKARLGNAGGRDAGAFKVTFYDGDPALPGAIVLGSRDVAGLASEAFVDLAVDGIATLTGRDLFAVADPEHRIRECTLANNTVSIPARPRVVVGRIAAATDQPAYGPNAPVALLATIANPGRFPYAYVAQLRVEDALGAPVVRFPARAIATVAPGGNASVAESWSTGLAAAGDYRVVADLFDVAGNALDSAAAPFAIGTGLAGSAIDAKIAADKAAYASLDTVRLTDRVTNLAANLAVDGLTAVTTMIAPDGTSFFAASATLGALAAGGDRTLPYAVPLANGMAGAWRATLSVLDAAGVERARSEAAFTVLAAAQSGAGLTGELAASPRQVPQGDAVVLVGAARNAGNADIAALPLRLRLVDGDTGALLQEFAYTADLARLGRFDIAASWNTAPARVGATVAAVLSAQAGERTVVLAQDAFVVTEPPVKLDVAQARVANGRVLVLLSCQKDRDSGDDGSSSGSSQGKDASSDADDTSESHRDAACLAARVAFVDAYLDGLGIAHRITTDRDEFRRLFRSGAFGVYWLSGGGNKLHDPLADEVREAVRRGDALVLDGVHDNRNESLDEAAGIHAMGKLGPLDAAIAVTGPLFDAATLATAGRPLRVRLEGGRSEAVFAGSANPAIVSHAFGLGRGLLFSFDLVASLQKAEAAGGGAAAGWKSLATEAFAFAIPALPPATTAGGFASLRTTVKNLARAVDVQVVLTPPAGADVAATEPAATIGTDGAATWRFGLPAGASRTLDAQLQLPDASGTYAASTVVSTIRDAGPVPYTTLVTPIDVAAAVPGAPALANALRALTFADAKDREARDKAARRIDDALAELARSRHEDAIRDLVDAVESLGAIAGRDMGAYVLRLDLLIEEIGQRWLEAQP